MFQRHFISLHDIHMNKLMLTLIGFYFPQGKLMDQTIPAYIKARSSITLNQVHYWTEIIHMS